MEIENIGLLHNELISIGLSISGCDSSGNISWLGEPNESLAPLVLAAHDKALSSDEALALEAAVTPEQWLAYQECRKQPIRNMRAERYKIEADPLILSSIESALVATTPTDGKYEVVLPEESVSEWLTIKNTIRSENPYPE